MARRWVRLEPFASDLGIACGLAFDADGTLFVGDRSGTIFRVDRQRACDGARVAAVERRGISPRHRARPRHLCHGADAVDVRHLCTASRQTARSPRVAHDAFGRPQGLAFDARGALFIIEALAGASGFAPGASPAGEPELVLSGPGLVGVAFGPDGALVVCSNAHGVPRHDAADVVP